MFAVHISVLGHYNTTATYRYRDYYVYPVDFSMGKALVSIKLNMSPEILSTSSQQEVLKVKR